MTKRPYQKPRSLRAPIAEVEKLLAESYAKNAQAWQARSLRVRAAHKPAPSEP